jgi:ATP/maltotriose-dependent transcriptional regulator MalT
MRNEPIPHDIFDAAMDDPLPWLAATARMIRAHLALNFGHSHTDAEADFRIALERYRSIGERWGTSFALASLGTLTLWRGDYAAAALCYGEAVTVIRELGALEDGVQFQTQLARALWLLGERDRAHEALAGARREADRLGLPEPRGQVAYVTGDLRRLDGDLDGARAELLRARDLVKQRPAAPQYYAVVAAALVEVAIAARDPDAARIHYAEAVSAAASARDAPVIAQVLVAGADLARYDGDPATAATLLGASRTVRGTRDLSLVDYPRVAAAARAALGDTGFADAYRAGQAVTMGTWHELAGIEPGRQAPRSGA